MGLRGWEAAIGARSLRSLHHLRNHVGPRLCVPGSFVYRVTELGARLFGSLRTCPSCYAHISLLRSSLLRLLDSIKLVDSN